MRRTPLITSWQGTRWDQVEANVHALQRRIYRAQQQGQRGGIAIAMMPSIGKEARQRALDVEFP